MEQLVAFGAGAVGASVAWFFIARNNQKRIADALGLTFGELKARLKKYAERKYRDMT